MNYIVRVETKPEDSKCQWVPREFKVSAQNKDSARKLGLTAA